MFATLMTALYPAGRKIKDNPSGKRSGAAVKEPTLSAAQQTNSLLTTRLLEFH